MRANAVTVAAVSMAMLAGAWDSACGAAGAETNAYAQGLALVGAFKNAEALPFLEQAHAADPTNVVVLTKLTAVCGDVGQDLDSKESEAYYEKALAYAEKLHALAPDSAETCFQLCVAYGNMALFRGGKQKVTLSRHIEEMAQEAIKRDPAYSPPYAVLGVYYREVATLNPILRAFAQHLLGGLPGGSLEESERMFRQAIEKDPGNVYAHYQLAVTYDKMGKLEQSAEMYRKVLSLPIVDHQDSHWRQVAASRCKAPGKS